jgi:hypothetical protein
MIKIPVYMSHSTEILKHRYLKAIQSVLKSLIFKKVQAIKGY